MTLDSGSTMQNRITNWSTEVDSQVHLLQTLKIDKWMLRTMWTLIASGLSFSASHAGVLVKITSSDVA